MRKNLTFSLIIAVCVVVLSFAFVKPEATITSESNNSNPDVVTVAKTEETNKVLETRFLNMLNHNFVYNNDFYDDSSIVNNSVLALLDLSEDSYIEQTYVADYIFNMYGKNYDDFGFLGENAKDGLVYVIPRGYDIYTHKIASVTDNRDGSYTVFTEVEVSYEDGSVETLACETVFLENGESDFGYNIMYSEISENISKGIDC